MININGTYLDAPLHRFPDGYSIADIPFEKLVDLPFEMVILPEGKKYFGVDDINNVGKLGERLFSTLVIPRSLEPTSMR